jgi:hypothetical protein
MPTEKGRPPEQRNPGGPDERKTKPPFLQRNGGSSFAELSRSRVPVAPESVPFSVLPTTPNFFFTTYIQNTKPERSERHIGGDILTCKSF